MIFGNLANVLDGQQTLYESIQNMQGIGDPKGAGAGTKLSKIFYKLSHYGMDWTDKVQKNMVAVPADKLLLSDQDKMLNGSLYSGLLDNWKNKPEEDKPFREKTLEQKRETLRNLAMQPELEDILDILANECIVYDDDNVYIGKPYIDNAALEQLNEESSKAIQNCIDASFYKIYMLLDWKKRAWDMFKRWLIDGVVAFEIIYDNLENPHTITGIIDVDPATLTRVIDKGMQYWVQFKDVIGKERRLLDAQIIYVKYEDTGVSDRQSYLERLIRPFNIYRIIEQAQVIWTVTQASFKTMFTIPVNGMNRAKGMQTLNSAMNRYREDISFNTETGELSVNGKANLPFNKEYWMPENENGKPEIETITDAGPSLNDSEQLKYHISKLYKMSKIPENRFDKESASTWFGTDPSQTLRDEINFGRFVARLQNSFATILVKPLQIQLVLSIPEMKNDKRILDAIGFMYNSYNQFTEMMNIDVDTKRMEFIATMRDAFITTDAEGNEERFFSDKFLIQRYLKMSESDLEWNEKCKMEEKQSKSDEEQEGDEGTDDQELDGGVGGDEGTGDEGSGDMEQDTGAEGGDTEMMGDVEPDNTSGESDGSM